MQERKTAVGQGPGITAGAWIGTDVRTAGVVSSGSIINKIIKSGWYALTPLDSRAI